MRADRPTGRRLGPELAHRDRPTVNAWLRSHVPLPGHALLPSGNAGGDMREDRFELDAVGRALSQTKVDLAEILEKTHFLTGGKDGVGDVGKVAVDRLQDVLAGRARPGSYRRGRPTACPPPRVAAGSSRTP